MQTLRAEIQQKAERVEKFQQMAESLVADNSPEVTEQVESQAETRQQHYQGLLDRIKVSSYLKVTLKCIKLFSKMFCKTEKSLIVISHKGN